MFVTKLKLATVVFLTIGIVCGAGVFMQRALADKPAAQAIEEKPKKQSKEGTTELTGVVQSVDSAKNALTVFSKLIGVKTFDVAKDAKIYLDDGSGGKLGFKVGTLADIAEGFVVTVRLSEDRNRVIGLFAEGSNVRGVLKAVAVAQRTITVTISDKKNESEQDKTFEVAKTATVVMYDGKPKDKFTVEESKLEDIPVGAVITLKLSADQKIVSNIQAEGPDIQGVVTAVDGGKNTVTVNVNDGKQTVEKTFDVLPTASVVISDGKDKGKKTSGSSKLTDLPVGAHVTLKLSPDQKAVLSVSAQGESITGVVKTVDAARNSLTLTYTRTKGESAEEKTFDVPKDASVRIDGKESKLSDLPTEAVVTINLSADQKTVDGIQAEGQGVNGVVKAVDAGQNSITLAVGKSGEERILAVSKDAQIIIDGRPGKLANVPVEAMATAKLTADQKGIVNLGVSGPSIQGVLKAVDATKGKITVTVPVSKVDSENKVFDLAKQVAVAMVSGKNSVPLRLADLKPGQEVVLRLTADQKAVAQITVGGE